jgi:ergothioneine biosynthesis protein EgtB
MGGRLVVRASCLPAPAHQLATRLVTNVEYLAFMKDGGYDGPEFWLSEGWATLTACGWRCPLYSQPNGRDWRQFTLGGLRPVAPAELVSHMSDFEADACAHWAGARLPTEAEWEVASEHVGIEGHFAETGPRHPRPAEEVGSGCPMRQKFGTLWEWTASPYTAHPGYRPLKGALGEYNGKLMCNQFVLRGGSCATPQSHIRRTYRNSFPPAARWQFTGSRPAK